MIPKNLKVGDTFKDGDYTYEVMAIVPEGYSSVRVFDENAKSIDVEKEVDVPEASKPSVNYTKTQINRMPNSELEKVSKELGLPVGTGTEMKRALIDRLGL